jgi:hypothetical protein
LSCGLLPQVHERAETEPVTSLTQHQPLFL